MTPEQQLQGTQIALQIAQNMLAQRDAQIIDLAAKLNMAEAENATLKAAQAGDKERDQQAAEHGHG